MYKEITRNTLQYLNEKIDRLHNMLCGLKNVKFPTKVVIQQAIVELEDVKSYMLNTCDYQYHKDNK